MKKLKEIDRELKKVIIDYINNIIEDKLLVYTLIVKLSMVKIKISSDVSRVLAYYSNNIITINNKEELNKLTLKEIILLLSHEYYHVLSPVRKDKPFYGMIEESYADIFAYSIANKYLTSKNISDTYPNFITGYNSFSSVIKTILFILHKKNIDNILILSLGRDDELLFKLMKENLVNTDELINLIKEVIVFKDIKNYNEYLFEIKRELQKVIIENDIDLTGSYDTIYHNDFINSFILEESYKELNKIICNKDLMNNEYYSYNVYSYLENRVYAIDTEDKLNDFIKYCNVKIIPSKVFNKLVKCVYLYCSEKTKNINKLLKRFDICDKSSIIFNNSSSIMFMVNNDMYASVSDIALFLELIPDEYLLNNEDLLFRLSTKLINMINDNNYNELLIKILRILDNPSLVLSYCSLIDSNKYIEMSINNNLFINELKILRKIKYIEYFSNINDIINNKTNYGQIIININDFLDIEELILEVFLNINEFRFYEKNICYSLYDIYINKLNNEEKSIIRKHLENMDIPSNKIYFNALKSYIVYTNEKRLVI